MHGLNQALMSSAAGMFSEGRLNVNAMRPFIDTRDGQHKVVVNHGDEIGTVVTNAAATLQYDEWKDIDRTVIEVATQRMVGVMDLRSRGLTHPLGSIGVTISQWDRSSDMTGADVDMSGLTPGQEDTPTYLSASVPVPVVHKDFRVNLRRLEASRRFGEAIDVTAASLASRVVAEKCESMLFLGDTSVGTIPGYITFTDRNQVTMTTAWTSIATANNNLIVADVIAMQQASRNDRHYGPWMLYIPAAYEYKLDEDYKTTVDTRTVRERIMTLGGIQGIQIADFLTGNNVLLVELTRETVDLAMAQDVTTVQWSEMGGMQERFKVMTIMVPRLKSDYDGRCGITHLRPD